MRRRARRHTSPASTWHPHELDGADELGRWLDWLYGREYRAIGNGTWRENTPTPPRNDFHRAKVGELVEE